jgi:hypothetical protein
MNHDTNREDRTTPEKSTDPIEQARAAAIKHGWIKAGCLECGARSDPYGNLPCGHQGE